MIRIIWHLRMSQGKVGVNLKKKHDKVVKILFDISLIYFVSLQRMPKRWTTTPIMVIEIRTKWMHQKDNLLQSYRKNGQPLHHHHHHWHVTIKRQRNKSFWISKYQLLFCKFYFTFNRFIFLFFANMHNKELL